MGEQKLIAWRGNDVGVRLHIARVPAIQSVVAPCWDVVSAGRDGEFACGHNNGFFRSPKYRTRPESLLGLAPAENRNVKRKINFNP